MRPEPKLSVKIALVLLGLLAAAVDLWEDFRERRRDA